MGQLIWSESPVKKFVNKKLFDEVVKYNALSVEKEPINNFENAIKTLEEKGIKENE